MVKEMRPLEKDIQRAICEWLAEKKIFFWRSNNVPVFGKSADGVRRFRALPKYTPRGLPDIMCIIQGQFIGLEVKREKGKIRPEQEVFALNILHNGGNYYIVHSVEEVEKIKEFKILDKNAQVSP